MGEIDFEDTPGLLSNCKLSEGELVLFLEYLTKVKHDEVYYYILFKCFNQKDVFKFLDLSAGKSIRIAKRKEIFKIYEYIRIYSYLKTHGIDEKTVSIATKKFKKRGSSILRIYNKVDEVLTSDFKDYVLKENEEENDE